MSIDACVAFRDAFGADDALVSVGVVVQVPGGSCCCFSVTLIVGGVQSPVLPKPLVALNVSSRSSVSSDGDSSVFSVMTCAILPPSIILNSLSSSVF